MRFCLQYDNFRRRTSTWRLSLTALGLSKMLLLSMSLRNTLLISKWCLRLAGYSEHKQMHDGFIAMISAFSASLDGTTIALTAPPSPSPRIGISLTISDLFSSLIRTYMLRENIRMEQNLHLLEQSNQSKPKWDYMYVDSTKHPDKFASRLSRKHPDKFMYLAWANSMCYKAFSNTVILTKCPLYCFSLPHQDQVDRGIQC